MRRTAAVGETDLVVLTRAVPRAPARPADRRADPLSARD